MPLFTVIEEQEIQSELEKLEEMLIDPAQWDRRGQVKFMWDEASTRVIEETGPISKRKLYKLAALVRLGLDNS